MHLLPNDDAKRVTMKFHAADKPYTIETNGTGLDCLAVIVPLVGNNGKSDADKEPVQADDTEVRELRAAMENASRTIETIRAENERLTHINGLLRKAHDVLTAKMQ